MTAFEVAIPSCSATEPELWYPDRSDNATASRAKQICSMCPVRAACLEAALANRERFGIWGGLTEEERAPLIGETGACGTYPKGYNRHKARGEQPCDDCRLAANDYAAERRRRTVAA